MLRAFKSFILEESLLEPEQRILLGVSGGCDSIVMVDLFRRAGFQFDIAHCNFQLRGEESLRDERFVEELSRQLGVRFFLKRFQTSNYARSNRVSIQMAARELRYQWFSELTEQHGYDYVAMAHHMDDQVETFFINLIRGTGVAGLQGISPKQGQIIRPMLFATRKEIEHYQSDQKLPFCTDSTNLAEKYLRNKIRHQLVPLLTEMNPDFLNGIIQTLERLKESGEILKGSIVEATGQLIRQKGSNWVIGIPELQKLKPVRPYLVEILTPLGFNYTSVTNIAAALNGPSGKVFLSSTHCLIKDRSELIVQPLQAMQASSDTEYLLDKGVMSIEKPLQLKFEEYPLTPDCKPEKDPRIATLDADRVGFPLVLRKWRRGDRFQPYGMRGQKKLSDFFVDKKLSLFEKENTWLLESDHRIAWVIGHRIDERFRITCHTRQIFRIEWIP